MLEKEFDKLEIYKKDLDIIKDQERIIAKQITLFTNRWNSICELKKLWRNRRVEYRNSEILLIENEFSQLDKLKRNITKESFIEKVESLFTEYIKLIEEQEKLITAEEDLQKELDQLILMREEKFNLAIKYLSM